MGNILITGATGQLGNVVVEHLLAKVPAQQIVVLVRDEQKAASLKAKGVQIRVGNYHDVASLIAAMQGIDKVLLISSNDFNDRFGQHKNAVDAAKQAGVKHIYYTGVAMKDIDSSPLKPLLGDHAQTEAYIKASGLTYTFLQNSLYLEVIPMFVGAEVLETGIFFAGGEGEVSFAARKDLGEVTASILVGEGHENKTYRLSNTVAYSFGDIANELSALSGKKVPYISPDEESFEKALKAYGLPAEIVLMSVLFAAGIKNNDFSDTDNTLEQFLGRPQTDLKAFLQEVYQR